MFLSTPATVSGHVQQLMGQKVFLQKDKSLHCLSFGEEQSHLEYLNTDRWLQLKNTVGWTEVFDT